ncbi:right-handed parallel beta-helix repeat-containing protein [Actinoplanes regularis]|uniref:right-handed parallel beta-helix repeat-containing protein n=1 Tax=Actinoplanes regularis TaxID=52697 RepID=UPI002557B71C|nr:right-handed parallel beta-helix repeat-containing protein [Actinoplanes regularis]
MRIRRELVAAALSLLVVGACSSQSGEEPADFVAAPASSAVPGPGLPSVAPSVSRSVAPSPSKTVKESTLPKPGNPAGRASIPAAARPVNTSRPDRTVGNGTPASCTSAAVVKAVAAGGIITFDCGPAPVTITMTATAKVKNAHTTLVLDGGNKVTLSGGGKRRILYMNTCDEAQGWTTSHCQDQETPRMTIQNMAFTGGNSTGDKTEGGGGGAIFVRGGHLKVINSRFTNNKCDRTGPDLGGAAIRVLDQGGDTPVYIAGSTFTGGTCSNGSALSSIGVSWTVLNSVFSGNSAVGKGANPARSGTPGGGSGGAIYLDGDRFTLTLDGTVIENNKAVEGGGAIFFVSNDRTGTLIIRNSKLRKNPSAGFETTGLPGIFYLGSGNPKISGSKLA